MDLNKTCRTCYQSIEHKPSVDLFKTIDMDSNEILQLSSMLEMLTGLQFSDIELDLSTRLCFECVRMICESFYFRQKCIETDTEARTKLKETSDKFEVVEYEADDDFYWDEHEPVSWTNTVDENVVDELLDEYQFCGDFSDLDNSGNLGKREHKCKYCGTYYNSISFLKKHILSKHADLIKQNEIEFEYKCKECGRDYSTYTNIWMHTKKKHPEYFKTSFKQEVKDNKYTYLCEFCGKGYKCPKTLNIHIRNHTGEKPYKCYICEKNFTSEPFLRDHKRRHTDPRNLICVICNKGFSRKKYLDLHVKLHADNETFECHICSKRCVGRGRLVFHLKYHSRLNREKGDPPISMNKRFIASLKPISVEVSEKTFVSGNGELEL